MGSLSLWHWIVVAVLILLVFGGRGKISSLMGDFAQGIKAFKKGMSEDETAEKKEPVKTIDHQAAQGDGLKNRSETERKVEGSLS